MLIEIFKSVLLISAVGGLLSVFLLCLKPITRKLFSPKWQYYIWLTVLIVMVLPVRFSLPQKTPDIPAIATEQVQNVQTDIETPIMDNQTTIIKPTQQAEKLSIPKFKLPQNIFYYLSCIWILGAIFIFFAKIIKYCLFLRAIHKNSEIDTTIENIPKRLKVQRTDMLDAPLIVGLVKPTLYLPDTELSEGDLNYILMHELTHYRRHDLLYKWFTMLVLSIHWFNPLMHIVSKQIDLDCEVSCDAEVAGKLSKPEQDSYMNMILGLLTNSRSNLRPLTTQMASNKKTLKRRFEMIRNMKKTSKFMSALSAVLALVMLGTTVFASGVLSDLAADDYTVEITNNGEKIELANKPFIENGEVYLPLREIFEKVGIMNRPESEIMWNNGEISIIRMPEEEERLNGKIGLEYQFAIGKKEVTQHIIHDVYNDMNGYSSSMWKAPLLKKSVTYIPFEYSEFMLMGHGDNINIDYSVLDNNGAEKTVEVIKGMSRKLTRNEAMKIVADPSVGEQACYDSLSRFGTELENGRIEAMKQYCTDNFIKTAFYDNTFLGVKSGKLPTVNSIYLYPDGKYRVTYTFYPYPSNSDDEGQRFIAVMEEQPDGRMLIDEIIDEQKIKIRSIN